MRNRWTVGVAIIVTLIFGILSAVMAKKAAGQVGEYQVYTATQGTTLWNLACKGGDCNAWHPIFRANVKAGYLTPKDSTWDAQNKWVRVNIRVGQTLVLDPNFAEHVDEYVKPAARAVASQTDLLQKTVPGWNDFGWILFALAIAFLVLAATMFWRSLQNATTAGPPIREEGINDQSAPDYFRQQASRMNTDRGGMYIPADQIRLISIIRGRGFGPIGVRYRGEEKPKLKVLNGESVYRAMVEYPDGRQEDMYCLQACANDLVYAGTRYHVDRLFRFETDTPTSIYSDPPQMTASFDGYTVGMTTDDISVTCAGRTFTFDADGVRRHPEGGVIVSAAGRRDVIIQNGRLSGEPIVRRSKKGAPAPSVEADIFPTERS